LFIYINHSTTRAVREVAVRKLTGFFNVYRVVVIIGFLIAAALCLAIPAHNNEPDDWAYYYAVKNFSQGKLTVDDFIHLRQEMDAGRQGGMLIQYYRIGFNKWILEKPPGYVFFLVPFELMGIPRWGNVFLALGMTIVTYILLKRLKNEKAACIGSLLMLFTPASLIMFNRSYADAFAASAFLVMGGGLYIYYCLERDRMRPLVGAVLLFLGFLFLGWSVVVRYTDLPIAVIFVLHFVITRLMSLWKKEGTRLRFEIPSVVLGAGLPLACLLWYNVYVFGSPFDNGYNYTLYPVRFAYDYFGQVDADGQSVALNIILGNLRNVPWNLLLGYPLLCIGVPGVIFIYYRKIFKRRDTKGTWAGLKTELPWDVLLVLTGWFISVFGLYMMYEWTSTVQMSGLPHVLMSQQHFIVFARFYLPGLFPLVVIVSLIAARFPVWLYGAVLLAAVVSGSVLYVQSALAETLIPQLILPERIPPKLRP
jgi:hypothetical protein